MRRNKNLLLMVSVLGLCLMAVGCAHNFGLSKRTGSAEATDFGMAQASDESSPVQKKQKVKDQFKVLESQEANNSSTARNLPAPPSAEDDFRAPTSQSAHQDTDVQGLEEAPVPSGEEVSATSWTTLAAPQEEDAPWPNGFTAPPKRPSNDIGNRLVLQNTPDPILDRESDSAPVPTEFVEELPPEEPVETVAEPVVVKQQPVVEQVAARCPPPMAQPLPPCPAQMCPPQEPVVQPCPVQPQAAQVCPPATVCPPTTPCPTVPCPPRHQLHVEAPQDQMAVEEPAAPEVVPAPQGMPAETPQQPAAVAADPAEPTITLHVDDQEVRKVLEMVSRQAKILNILVSPGVSGLVTLNLQGKSVDETLHIIAKQCRLSVRREKDVIYISTLEEARKVEEDDLPIRLYRLNYVRSSDVQLLIKPMLSSKGRFTASKDSDVGLTSDITDTSSTGSSGGTKKVDAGGNTLAGCDVVIVQDYEYILKAIDRMIAELDVQPVQVMIEAVIVQLTRDKDLDLGLSIGVIDAAGKAVSVMGNGSLINAAAGFTPSQPIIATTGKLTGGMSPDTYGGKMGWSNSSTTGYIQAIEGLGETKILACPRLLVLNKQRAEIHLGANLGYQTTTVNQTSSTQTVSFIKTGTQLRLRPFVSSDGMIRMEVHPERSTGALDDDGIPQTKLSQVTTNVMVPDGGTLVIGGLLDSEDTETWSGVPLLSRLPWVGYLFRHTVDAGRKKELVVVLTPRICRPECPEATNYVGRPRSLGLEHRVLQKAGEEKRDGKSLYEIIKPDGACPPAPPSTQGKPDQQ